MSSTTSSDCESCDCSQCTYSFENNQNEYGKLVMSSRHVPIYATMAQPLIYYAQVQQPKNWRQNNDQPKKDNPFKKAFKWYTQERCRMLSNKPDICLERSGFASWLDNKYDEYMREGGQPMKVANNEQRRTMNNDEEQRTYESRIPRDSLEVEPSPGGSNKYGRKRPWNKRRRSINDGGDVPQKGPCGSCEYILKPKDLTRATSEHTPTSGGKSNATVTSINMTCNTKCSGRSHSLSDVGREKSVPKHGETVTHLAHGPRAHEQDLTKMPTMNCACHHEQEVQVPPKSQEPVTQCKCPHCLCPREDVPEGSEVVKISLIKQQPCCPCPTKKIPQVDKMPSKTKPPQVDKISSKTKPPVQPQEKLQEVVKQDPSRLSYCPCPQENVAQVEKLPSNTQKPTYPPVRPIPVQEKLPEIEKVPSKTQDQKNQPQQETESELVKVPSKAQETKKQPIPQQEKVPKAVKIPSKGQNLTDQPGPCCKCNLKKVPEVVQVPSQSRAVQESCQVPEDKIIPVNEGTQYEPAVSSPRSTQQNVRPCCCNTCNPPFPPPSPIICLPVKVQSSKISSPETYLITPSAVCEAPKKQKKTTQRRSVSCQFDEGSKSKVDTQSEHQTEPCICSKHCFSTCHSVNQVSDPVPIQRQSHSTVAISEEAGECGMLREVAVVNKFTRSVTCAANGAAQTSDHSICFDKDGVCNCQCPLFLKIIYADIKE